MLACLLGLMMLAGCARQQAAPGLRYVLGPSYQAQGIWHYPAEDFTLDETGLASVAGSHGPYTADGEAFDQSALAAGHPTLQLPALARITNLENGRTILVRVNDRGPANPGRALELTRRAALLLAVADPAAVRVRIQVQEAESRAMVASLRQEGPKIVVATPASTSVQSESLAPPSGAGQSARVRSAAAAATAPVSAPLPTASEVPLRLAEAVQQGQPRPGTLAIACSTFGELQYAEILRQRLASFGARTTTDYAAPRDQAYRVRISGLASIAAADAMLAQVHRAGVTGAQIIIE